jgi:ribosome-binding factor A
VSRRTERIAEQLKGEIARVLHEEVTDPRVRMVTLTRVDCAPDLSSALVFWSSLAADDVSKVDEIEAGLDSAAAFVRRRIAQVLPLRRTPRLLFRHDASLAAGSKMLSLLREIASDE